MLDTEDSDTNYLYCQNPECGVYLGSLGGNWCPHCGWEANADDFV